MSGRRKMPRRLGTADELGHSRLRWIPGSNALRRRREERRWHRRFKSPLGVGRVPGAAPLQGRPRSSLSLAKRVRLWRTSAVRLLTPSKPWNSSDRPARASRLRFEPRRWRKRLARRFPRVNELRRSALSRLSGGAGVWLRHPLRRGHLYPKPRKARPSSVGAARAARGPRMRPRKSVVERVVPGEPSPARTVVRLRVVGVLVVALFSLMFVRLWYLQVLDTKGFAQTVSANQLRNVEVPSPRGLILDRTAATMVGNQVTEDITLSRVSAQQHPQVIGQLATLLGISPQQIQGDLSNTQYSLYKPVPILQNAPMSDVLYIAEHSSQFPGVTAVADTNRTYPLCPTNPPGACRTGVQMLGYVGGISSPELQAHKTEGYQLGDQFGQAGLENEYQAALRGSPGIDHVEVDAHGQVVGSIGQTQPSPGYDLVTNVDGGLEQTLQQALDGEVASLGGASHGGAAVALDPQNGAVLALASSPTYDPTWWAPTGITPARYQQLQSDGSLNNLPIEGLYTPGSTFKLATASAALQSGLISPSYVYNDTGSYQIPGCQGSGSGCAVFHDNDGEVGGQVDVTRALTISSDIFFYNLGVMFWEAYKSNGRFGPTPIQDAANALGYGDVTGIDVPGETHAGRVDSPQVVAKEHAQDPKDYPDGSWFTGNNLELAFGQGGTVITPVEQAVAYASFANGGTRYAPELGAGLVDPITGKVVQRFAPKVMSHFSYSPENYQAMLAGFQGVVSNGTAAGAFGGFPLATFPLAGKTGTATVQEQQPNSWFIGWGPLPNPQYLIAVVVQGGGFGSQAAAPIVRQGFDYLVAHPESQTNLAAPGPTGPGAFPCAPSATTTTTSPSGSTTTTLPCTPTVGGGPAAAGVVHTPPRGGGGGYRAAPRSDRPRRATARAP